ncbi:MAG: hypothetical protein ACW98U_03120 [Candidatus Thorarchaeota archaeon]
MERRLAVVLLCTMLVVIPFTVHNTESSHLLISQRLTQVNQHSQTPSDLESVTGTLDPIKIEHIGTIAGSSVYQIGRTDVEPSPGSEAWLPIGTRGNSFSADCDGGYFLVGSGGSADFGSSSGTISLWLKWHLTAPNGRFWGQHFDFETRWAGNRLTLDWGTDTTFQGTKTDWIPDHWYFIAMTWDENTDSIAIYWGDETQKPIEDAITTTWTGNVSGLHTENDIMNSAARTTTQVDGHVDEFRYYDVQRNLEQLTNDYNITLTGSEPGLSNYYKFEDSFVDSSGSANLVPIGSTLFSHNVYIGEEQWRAEQIEVNVRNIRSLYVLNGSFEGGTPGVNVDWNGDGLFFPTGWSTQREILSTLGRQRSSYVNTGLKYVTLENEGYAVGDPIDYQHYNGTSIFWNQTVFNNQSSEAFDFGMNFLYQRGPIGQNFSDIFEFTFEILDGSSVLWNWSIDPTNITQRGVWYTVGPLSVNLPGAPTSFEARVSLKISTTGSFIAIPETDEDLDGDSANGQFITFMVDDVAFVGSEYPNFENVQLEATLPLVGTIPIEGEYGIGAIFADFKYWETVTIPISFSSNSSVSFEYSVGVSRMTKLCNSSSTPGLEQPGVAYSIESGERAELELFTYIQPYTGVEDLGFRVYFYDDWENPSITDPFGIDVTDQLIVNSHFIEIPTGLVETLGWWRIAFDSPNYVLDLSTQTLDELGSFWEDASIFHTNNTLRCNVVMGTHVEILTTLHNLEITWLNPLGSIFFQEEVSSVNNSEIVSSSLSLGPSNSTPGIWSVSVMWSNGSEVAFTSVTFEIHHSLMIIADTPNVVAESGEVFTAAIYVYDQDNGNQLFDGVTVIGNWSTQNIHFDQNMARGWFEADFNTSIVGFGTFFLVVRVSIPFYDTSEVSINVVIPSAEPLIELMFRAGILGALAFAILVGGIFVTRRFYTSTTTRWNLELLGLENRIDDARNLIGVLLIHKGGGLPVYSKILKGSFQEALLSSFISAISQFRTEFSLDEPKWSAIPITEVIMALQTEAFICAIVTVDSASDRQKAQLESFGLEVGGFYDHDDEATKQVLQTPKRIGQMTEHFDPIFEKHFDGALMKRYVGVKKSLPSRLDPISRAMKAMEIDHGVSPSSIIKSVIMLGFNERRAHMMVLEAIDEEYLIAAETKLPSPIPPTEE